MKLPCKRSVASRIRLFGDDWSWGKERKALVGSLFSHHPIINTVQMLP
jgi:hypothetical protein